jgi:hypothetical protein
MNRTKLIGTLVASIAVSLSLTCAKKETPENVPVVIPEAPERTEETPIPEPAGTTEIKGPTENHGVVLSSAKWVGGIRIPYIVGSVVNNTDQNVNFIMITFPLYDEAGDKLRYIAVDSANNVGLKPGGKWRFKCEVPEEIAAEAKTFGPPDISASAKSFSF